MAKSEKLVEETVVKLAGAQIQLFRGGSGEPLIVVHDEMGHPGWRRFHEALSRNNTLYLPLLPGYGTSDQLDWIMNMRDMAGWFLEALDDVGIGPVPILGFSIGGWLAAAAAAMDPSMFTKVVLVAPAGVKPPEGEILDIFPLSAKDFLSRSLLDPLGTQEFKDVCPDDPTAEQNEEWAVAREQSCRLSWKPYMYDLALPHLLPRLKNTPTLVIWGVEDTVIPAATGAVYRDSIPGAHLELIPRCGHRPELERTDTFVELVTAFLTGK